MKFDYIVANPPYNGSTNKKQGSLHSVIMLRVIDRIKDNGQLAVLHPSDWRFKTKSTKLLTEMYLKHTVRATFHDVYFSRYIWNVVTSVDEIILTKNNIPKTDVVFEDLDSPIDEPQFVDVTKWFKEYPLPTRHFDLFQDLITSSKSTKRIPIEKVRKTPVEILHQKEKDSEYKYPVLQKILKPKRFNEGLYHTSIKPHGDNLRPKIILSWGSLHNMLDLDGKYQALKQGNFFIFDSNDDKEKLKNLYDGLDNIVFKLLFASFLGSDQRIIVDQHFKKLMVLEYFKDDFWVRMDEIIKELNLDKDSFHYSVSRIAKSGKYKKYQGIAKLGMTWEEHRVLSQAGD